MRSNSVSRPTVTGACHAMTINTMTNHKGRAAITLYSGAAVLALAVGNGGRVGGESPSNTTTPTTITTTRSPFSDLTEVPAPPAPAGGQTDGAVPGRLIGGPEGCIAGLNCGCIPRICYTARPRQDDPPGRQPPSDRALSGCRPGRSRRGLPHIVRDAAYGPPITARITMPAGPSARISLQ
jgi:hypothetical protein